MKARRTGKAEMRYEKGNKVSHMQDRSGCPEQKRNNRDTLGYLSSLARDLMVWKHRHMISTSMNVWLDSILVGDDGSTPHMVHIILQLEPNSMRSIHHGTKEISLRDE